jgi:hypothetical protein
MRDGFAPRREDFLILLGWRPALLTKGGFTTVGVDVRESGYCVVEPM